MSVMTEAFLLLGFAAGLAALIFLAAARPSRHWAEPKPMPGDVRMGRASGGRLRVDVAHDVNGTILWCVRYIGTDADKADAAYREAIDESRRMHPGSHYEMRAKVG